MADLVDMLPQESEVLLVHADRIRDLAHRPVSICHRGVQVPDLTEAVAAQREGVGVVGQSVLTRIERVLPVYAVVRIAIGNDQLGDGEPMGDRSNLLAVAEAHLVQHQPLPLVDAHPQRPPLPVHPPSLDRE